jgi:hypothetical protein
MHHGMFTLLLKLEDERILVCHTVPVSTGELDLDFIICLLTVATGHPSIFSFSPVFFYLKIKKNSIL